MLNPRALPGKVYQTRGTLGLLPSRNLNKDARNEPDRRRTHLRLRVAAKSFSVNGTRGDVLVVLNAVAQPDRLTNDEDMASHCATETEPPVRE